MSERWTYDRSYRPELPAGAVRGNPSRQEFCEMCHVPRYFYVDEEKTCLQCGDAFLFGAAEQRYWYETLGFNLRSKAVRCPTCRRRRRTARAVHRQLEESLEDLRQNPDEPAALLSAAEATARLHQIEGRGDLDRAIAHARRAAKLWPDAREPLFWEGLCQHLAGRPERARPRLEEFLRVAGTRRRFRTLAREAQQLLGSPDSAEASSR